MGQQKSTSKPKNGHVVFVCNGINRAFPDNAISWEELLEVIKASSAIIKDFPKIKEVDLSNPLKPFPFAFDEFVYSHENPNFETAKLLKGEIHNLFYKQVAMGKIL